MLPLRPDPGSVRTHDHKRHGTVTLCATPEVVTGKITADACYLQHRQR
jgi:hypothetical protein